MFMNVKDLGWKEPKASRGQRFIEEEGMKIKECVVNC